MPLFRRSVPDIELDKHLAQDDLALRAAFAAAEAGDWAPARDLMAGVRGDFGLRDRYTSILGEAGAAAEVARASGPVDLTIGWADRWAEAEPGNPDAAVLRARTFLDRAWEVRGSGWASTVGEDAWPEFRRILGEAVPLCHRAAELAPHDPAPWNVLFWAAIGLGVPRDQADYVFSEVVGRDPLNVAGHNAMLSYLCEKWYGSHEEMFAFARESSAAAPVGSPLHVLPIWAAAEWVMRVRSQGDRKASMAVLQEAYRGERIRADQDRALTLWFAKATRHATWYADLNTLAYGLAWSDRHKDNKPVFEAIGPYMTELPWAWRGGDEEFHKSRRKAMAK